MLFMELQAFTPVFCETLLRCVQGYAERLYRVAVNVPEFSPLRFLCTLL